MRLTALPAFEDNYIWARVAEDGRALLVDPGQAGPVMALAEQGVEPVAVLLTHHHDDHIGGVAALLQRWPALQVVAPHDPRIPMATRRVADGEQVELLGATYSVLEVPGHTLGHVAYHGDGVLFSGDTLFSLGCGRMFEGSAAQMLASLQRLASLPGDTLVCCGHEYTLANAAFALQVEPSNAALQRRQQDVQAMRHAARPTLPIPLSSELACNPFLRTDAATVQDAVAIRLGRRPDDEVETFAELRRWKDDFRA